MLVDEVSGRKSLNKKLDNGKQLFTCAFNSEPNSELAFGGDLHCAGLLAATLPQLRELRLLRESTECIKNENKGASGSFDGGS